MIVVTGGAGFIGSVLVWALNRRGRSDIVIVDHLGKSEKWKNLVGLAFSDFFDKTDFLTQLEAGAFNDRIEAIVHLGACSSTTETDAGYLMENNYRYTQRIARWRVHRPGVRFVYASSAATYGDGSCGYDDDESALQKLRPLNMYGYSKHLFDLRAQSEGWLQSCAGIKYFNVFGPNEDHKADMRSLINKAFPTVSEAGTMRLFKSHRPDYADGEQVRDFIYVKDAVAMTLFLLDHSGANGIYNVGTGKARSWNDVAAALFAALGKEVRVDYVPMPDVLRGKYQYFTQASLTKLRAAGSTHECLSLEAAVADYVNQYLVPGRRIADG